MQALRLLGVVLSFLMLGRTISAQATGAAITGIIRDGSGAVVPQASLALRRLATGQVVETTASGADGEFAFRNLSPSTYDIRVTKPGFEQVISSSIDVSLDSARRVEIVLPVGTQKQRVEVAGASSLLNTPATQEHGIGAETLLQLPVATLGSGPRHAAAVAILMPGVQTGGGDNAFDARINGGLQSSDEALVDGVSMQQGYMSQSGMVSIFQDFPMTPDMVSEVKVLTSNYAPEYGSTTSGQIMAVTRAGGSSFHGATFEYRRSDAITARPWGSDTKPEYRLDNFGANLGGPVKLPGLWNERLKSFFYFDYEGLRGKGGPNSPTISIPSLMERDGDFTDWRDADGELIPIYDPLTIRSDGHGGYLKDQFMGCDGRHPNVICGNRISPLVSPYLDALPTPTTSEPLNNYRTPPVPSAIANANYYLGRFDVQLRNDHLFASVYREMFPVTMFTALPQPIASEVYSNVLNSWLDRFNWERTFTSTLVNHMALGYLNFNQSVGCVNGPFVDQFPKIGGVSGHNVPPQMSFSDGFAQLGCNAGVNDGNLTTRPIFIINDAVTWVVERHTIKVGMEWRKLTGSIHTDANEAGSFVFGRGATGVLGINSGNPVASFLLGAVDSGSSAFRSVNAWYPRQHAWVIHAGDTWRVTDKLTVNYGVRWDYYSPSAEKLDRQSFLDPRGANSGAGGRPGRLAFAGDGYGTASFGAMYPEKPWYGALAPRLGGAYSIDEKTVVRGGWGIFYDRAFYPGWGGGVSVDGFANEPSFNATLGGIQPAFFLDQGFPQSFTRPPIISDAFDNGKTILYRPVDANRRPYSHQWNVTLDRQIAPHLSLSVAYVATRGRRLPSTIDPLNAVDPSYLRLGPALYDEFQPGATTLDGVRLPYDGWVEQLTANGCAPSVAQALVPYPQYCDSLQGLNENHGRSRYDSLQAKLEKRFSGGTYALVSYTLSKTVSSGSDNTQTPAGTWSGLEGVISPFERGRNEAIASSDALHVVSAAFVYELPFGRDKQVAGQAGRISNALIGGWQVSTIFRYSSGVPMYFRVSGTACNVPVQFRAGCIPALVTPSAVFAQDKSRFDPANGPLFNANAFEPVSAFDFYYGRGNRLEQSVRGFGFHNQDVTLLKNTHIANGATVQCRFEMFNVWNWHSFTSPGEFGSLAFDTDLASADFGKWNGSVTAPRSAQVALRVEF